MVFKVGLLPIILGIISLGLFAGKIAGRFGKNPLIWASFSVALIIAVTWRQIPIWAETIFYRSETGNQYTSPQPMVTNLAEAEKITIRLKIDGVNFDVPLVYSFKAYNQQLHGWLNVPRKIIDGKQRSTVNIIKLDTMLPDVSPLTVENLAQFEKLAWNQSVHASISPMVSWDDYFKYFFEKLQRKPDSKQLPGMLHFYDPTGNANIYLSHDQPSDDLIRIRCPDENFSGGASSICIVETSYRPEPDMMKFKPKKNMVFHLRYELPGQYIDQWSTIEQKLKSRLNRMVNINDAS